MNKKSQGLSLRTIVVAVLVLIVLIVVSSIVITNLNKGADELQNCGTRGGVCKADKCGVLEKELDPSTCSGTTSHCCIQVLS